MYYVEEILLPDRKLILRKSPRLIPSKICKELETNISEAAYRARYLFILAWDGPQTCSASSHLLCGTESVVRLPSGRGWRSVRVACAVRWPNSREWSRRRQKGDGRWTPPLPVWAVCGAPVRQQQLRRWTGPLRWVGYLLYGLRPRSTYAHEAFAKSVLFCLWMSLLVTRMSCLSRSFKGHKTW